MTQTTQQAKAADLQAALDHFTGTETYASLPYPWLKTKFLLTDGARFLAEQAGAFWLMDAIASHLLAPKVAAEPFQVWELEVRPDRTALLKCTDGNENLLARQEIPYTDFQLASIRLYAILDEYLGGWVALLPSEY